MSIAERMTEKLLSDEIISQKEAELVCYGLESIKSDLTGIAMSILIGGKRFIIGRIVRLQLL